MQTLPVRAEDPEADVLARAVAVLRSGQLVIYPTDTLYALGGRALDAGAAGRVRAAKGREEAKPLPLVAADRVQAVSLCSAWTQDAERLARRFWPGPLTLVLPASRDLPTEVTAGGPTIAVRVPGLRVTRELCALAGPLISTSANPAGATPPRTCGEAVAGVGGAAALALDAGPGRPVASTIVDLTGAAPRLVRAGLVPWEQVVDVLRGGGS